ncbi:MAG: isoprenyl transferase [Candidatus Omnitrophica bacterium]|nr:isoprenyl transferase [Candidatus Omnitrophota bacterium]MBU1134524.1 isoprenyl transferase [Candidatus Omnitrophota bacterium]MBU1367117.1 isoprenyl transferase [Candidatus Omnitrophota bacterium]MBU1523670.1 isoprenyl transferase [Candidatus Omnitrophota bacterium]
MNVPHHIAIIMDGNGRWAKKRGLPRTIGHREGVKRIKEIVREAKKLGVKILTIFAFSTENWNRSKNEIKFLFQYLNIFLKNYKKELMRKDIRLKAIGRRDRIDKNSIRQVEVVEELTKDNKSFIFNIALDYGGRWDITEAARRIVSDYQNKLISKEAINEDFFEQYLSLGGLASPDLLIRTSGEQRISNFLLWDLAYTELYFPQKYWPDFNVMELEKAIEVYSQRIRKFGKI